MLFALSLVAMVVVGTVGDCEYYAEGCGWVIDCCLNGLAHGFWFYLLLLRLGWWYGGVKLGAGFVFVVEWVGE